MSAHVLTIVESLGVLAGMVAGLELGYRIGRRRVQPNDLTYEGLGAIEAAIFALLGLLLGFAFAGAMSRLDTRRQLIVQETNVISTAYLRLDLLPAADQPEMRRLFRAYLEARVRAYDHVLDADETARQDAKKLQEEIWTRAVSAGRLDPTHNTARSVLPALNEMIDVTTARTVALGSRLPQLVWTLLIVVALLSALLAGYAMAKRTRRSLLHMGIYAVAVSITIYTVLDLDNPRAGLVRLDAAESVLRQLHDSIK
jgi:uncharacterized membrane protein YraQ (UPF0718 family)